MKGGQQAMHMAESGFHQHRTKGFFWIPVITLCDPVRCPFLRGRPENTEMLNSVIPSKDGSGRMGIEPYSADTVTDLENGTGNLTPNGTLVLSETVWGHKGGQWERWTWSSSHLTFYMVTTNMVKDCVGG